MTVGKIGEYVSLAAVAVSLIAFSVTTNGLAKEAHRLATENRQWQNDWERNGQLPDDVRQNAAIEQLDRRLDDLEDLDRPSRLARIEQILITIEEAVTH